MTLTPAERRIVRVLERVLKCAHPRCAPNAVLPPGLLECLDCNAIVDRRPAKRKPRAKRKRKRA